MVSNRRSIHYRGQCEDEEEDHQNLTSAKQSMSSEKSIVEVL